MFFIAMTNILLVSVKGWRILVWDDKKAIILKKKWSTTQEIFLLQFPFINPSSAHHSLTSHSLDKMRIFLLFLSASTMTHYIKTCRSLFHICISKIMALFETWIQCYLNICVQTLEFSPEGPIGNIFLPNDTRALGHRLFSFVFPPVLIKIQLHQQGTKSAGCLAATLKRPRLH